MQQEYPTLFSRYFTKRVAAVSSSPGMETYFTGATIDFAKFRKQWESLFSLIIRYLG